MFIVIIKLSHHKYKGIVVVIKSYQFGFFRENVVVNASSELKPVSNEKFKNSTFYGLFSRFLIFILIFNK